MKIAHLTNTCKPSVSGTVRSVSTLRVTAIPTGINRSPMMAYCILITPHI